jgi:hypothetical protein
VATLSTLRHEKLRISRKTPFALLAVLFAQDPVDYEGFGTILEDRLFLPDSGGEPVRIRIDGDAPEIGARLWISGKAVNGLLTAREWLAIPVPVPTISRNALLEAEMTDVCPWCDHMPVVQPGEKRQYLVVRVKLTNRTDRELTVDLRRSFLSFEEKREGASTPGLSIRGKDGRATGETRVRLAPGAEARLEFRGDGLYAEGNHGRRLHVLLAFAAGGEHLLVRRAGAVQRTD